MNITIELDPARLAGYTDEYLASLWTALQIAKHGEEEDILDELSDAARALRAEILRRWLAAQPAPIHNLP